MLAGGRASHFVEMLILNHYYDYYYYVVLLWLYLGMELNKHLHVNTKSSTIIIVPELTEGRKTTLL